MVKSIDQSHMSPKLRELPVEILTYILEFYVYQFDQEPYGRSSKYWIARCAASQLLGMRLVCKVWSEAIFKMCFHDVIFRKSKRADTILDNWTHSIYGSVLLCPVRYLCFYRLRYEEMGVQSGCEREESPRPPVTMYQAVRLIERLGLNVEILTLEFDYSMGFPPAMIKAVRPLENLKELHIEHFIASRHAPGICDPKSLADLITAIPRLESLSLREGWLLDGIRLRPDTLSNLKEFTFALYPNNIKGLAHICHTAKDSLKVISVCFEGFMEDDDVTIEPFKAILEGHFTFIQRGVIPISVLKMEFPQLRVMGINHCEKYTSGWLHSPMLQNVRTIVIFHSWEPSYPKGALKLADFEAFRTVPHIRHIIFVGRSDAKLDPELSRAFKLRGIQCHFVSYLSHDEILEFESKISDTLEGPKTKVDCFPGDHYGTYN